MKERRSSRKLLEERLRQRQPEVERLWRSWAEEWSPQLPQDHAERLERRMTWGLWAIALHEATALLDEVEAAEPEPHMAPPWLCQSCKRRLLRVVGGQEELSATG
jgi:hypothetical protein